MTSARPDTTVISVRADAHRSVHPDFASLHLQLHGKAGSKAASRSAVDASLHRITDALAAAGGAAESTPGIEQPLTWRVLSMHSHADYDGRGRPNGQYETYLSAVVTVRNFALLGEVESAIAAVDEADLSGVSWQVDDDNQAWPLVRADAIRSALSRGRDYATAIGGELLGIEQVSDVGLLGRSVEDYDDHVMPARAVVMTESGDAGGVGLDPSPQRISATIEARLRSTVGVLPR